MSCQQIMRVLIVSLPLAAVGCSGSDKPAQPNAGALPTTEDQKAPNTYHGPNSQPAETVAAAANASSIRADRAYTRPEVAGEQSRITSDIDMLRAESLQVSLTNLHDVNLYTWPGSLGDGYTGPLEFPLPAEAGRQDTQQILSNRRVSKVFDELSQKDPAEVARLISAEIDEALELYNELAADYIRENSVKFPVNKKIISVTPSFDVTQFNRGARPVLVGARNKVLALCFLAGNLKLQKCADKIKHVTKEAMDQYKDLSNNAKYHVVFGAGFELLAGLYHRQSLAEGLIGTSEPDLADRLRQTFARHLQRVSVPKYTSLGTQFDLPVRITAVSRDDRPGLVEYEFMDELSDVEFENILGAISGIPKG